MASTPAAAEVLPFMSFAVDRWLSDSAHLSDDQYAPIHRLLCHAWRRGGTLPNDTKALARMVGLSADELKALSEPMRHWFVESQDRGSLIAVELHQEYQRALELRNKKREGARKTNLKRRGSLSETDSDTLSDAHSGSISSRPSPSPSPSPNPSPHTSPSPKSERSRARVENGQKRTSDRSGELNAKIKALRAQGMDIAETAHLLKQYGVTHEQVQSLESHEHE